MDIEELIDSLRAYAADRHTRPPLEEVLTQAADAIEQLEREKADDVREARKANWVPSRFAPDIPVCSQCGFPPLKYRGSDDYCLSAYCPTCGAEMVAE